MLPMNLAPGLLWESVQEFIASEKTSVERGLNENMRLKAGVGLKAPVASHKSCCMVSCRKERHFSVRVQSICNMLKFWFYFQLMP